MPGSYIDIAARQGAIASGIGASLRLDFSSNIADGLSSEGLQDPEDRKGWRAAFFWNMNNNNELVLVAQNQVSCSGDKAGDGEAIAFDASGNRFGFNGIRRPKPRARGRRPPECACWIGPTSEQRDRRSG